MTNDLKEFFTFLSFPSVSIDPKHRQDVRDYGKWIIRKLSAMGLSTELHETPEHPIVIGLDEVSNMETEGGQFVLAFCIGGIKMEFLHQVLEAGARRRLIVSQLLAAADVTKATREARNVIAEIQLESVLVTRFSC